MIQPLLKGDALRADIEAADPRGGICVWWLGQSGFLIKSDLGQVLFDPYLSDSLARKYRGTDKPHVRMTARPIRPGALRNIDIVTSTHGHTDHLDADTLGPLREANPRMQMIIPEANRELVAERLGCDPAWPVGLTDGQAVAVGEIEIHAVPAAHNDIERDAAGRSHHLGYVVKLGGLVVYHSGDTLRYPGMAELLGPFDVDLAILPINGSRPERRVSGNLSGDEAAQLAMDIGAALAIPCHFDMFAFNTETPGLFVESCRSLGQSHLVLQCGERLTIPRAG